MTETFSSEDKTAWLQRQIAPVVASFGCTVHDGINPARPWEASCFFMIISDHWVMCTAAHVIDDIRTAMDSGITFADWHINDVFTNSSSTVAYPFNVMDQDHFRVRDDEIGLDYCLIGVDWLAAENVGKSGVRAITLEQVGDPEDAGQWILTGFPSSHTKAHGNNITQHHFLLSVTPIPRPDNWPPEQSRRALFGQLDTGEFEELNTVDIGGMSGGPIFGVYKQENGNLVIRLVAVQSGWSQASRIITACPIKPFLNAVQRRIDKLEDK